MRLTKFTLLLAAIMVAVACSQNAKKSSGIPSISAAQVKQMIEKGQKPFLLDVRTEEEYNGPMGHIQGSILIPLQELESRYKELEAQKDREIVIYCRSGNRSMVAARMLQAKGFKVVNMNGGMFAWNDLNKK